MDATIEKSCKVLTDRIPKPNLIVVDPVRELVYITDFAKVKVHVFTYEGNQIAVLGGKPGSLISPTGMSFRPGYYAPTSTFDGPQTNDKRVAGIPIKMPLSLRDVNNVDVDDASLIDVTRFSASALGSGSLKDGTYLENSVTISPDQCQPRLVWLVERVLRLSLPNSCRKVFSNNPTPVPHYPQPPARRSERKIRMCRRPCSRKWQRR